MHAERLYEADGRLRKSYSQFNEIAESVMVGWKDKQAERFRTETLERLPNVLSHACASIAELRELMVRAEKELADPAEGG